MTTTTTGEIAGWHYASRQPVRLQWREGSLTRVEPAQTPPPPNLWLAPALVDLQVNGYAGVDFQRDNLSSAELLRAARGLRADGCGRFLVTLITDEWEAMTRRLRGMKAMRDRESELSQAIAGWHFEGPFLSADPGFHGAHDPVHMLDPTPARIRQLRALTGADPLLLTLAPERPGALAAIALATSLGMKVSLGHTNASAEALRAALEAGATGFTHLGNACPQQLDRHDNILWRVLDTTGLTVSLIPDQIHVSPALFRLIHRVLEAESVFYTTDAMAAAGAPPGRFTLGPLELEVGADRVVRQPGGTNFAGSSVRPVEAAFRAAQMLGCDWQTVWDGLSVRPARFMGWDEPFQIGAPADFCLLEMAEAGQLRHLRSFRRGQGAD